MTRIEGLDIEGLDIEGLDIEGRDIEGLDIEGLDIEGLDHLTCPARCMAPAQQSAPACRERGRERAWRQCVERVGERAWRQSVERVGERVCVPHGPSVSAVPQSGGTPRASVEDGRAWAISTEGGRDEGR